MSVVTNKRNSNSISSRNFNNYISHEIILYFSYVVTLKMKISHAGLLQFQVLVVAVVCSHLTAILLFTASMFI